MPEIGPTQDGLRGTVFYRTEISRRPMRIDLGCAVTGAAQPVPDVADSGNFFLGLQHRVGRAPPLVSNRSLRSLKRFTRRFCRKRFKRIPSLSVPSFRQWLDVRPYTLVRKSALLAVYLEYIDGVEIRNLPQYANDILAFIKDECYDSEFKVPRGIYSRHDIFKCLVGPLCAAMEHSVYECRSFVKHIPVPDRPAYTDDILFSGFNLMDPTINDAEHQMDVHDPISSRPPPCNCRLSPRSTLRDIPDDEHRFDNGTHVCEDCHRSIGSTVLGGSHVIPPMARCKGISRAHHRLVNDPALHRGRNQWRCYGSDYSSFESHFTRRIMDAVEFEVYDYLCADLGPEYKSILSHFKHVLGGKNVIRNRRFGSGVLNACRMSGEMNTSLGNGLTNLIVNTYVLYCLGVTQATGIVEGDDGLFRYFGPELHPIDFKVYGWTIKISKHESPNEASFCGIVYDDVDKLNITNPISAILEFGWGSVKYAYASAQTHKKLLRAKSLSLIYSYPGCPILQSLGMYGLRMTEGLKYLIPSSNNLYDKEYMAMCMKYIKDHGLPITTTPDRTRLLVERLYGIPVATQLCVEAKLDSLTTLGELTFPELEEFFTEDQRKYYDLYSYRINKSFDLNLPRAKVPTQPLCFKRGQKEWACFFKTVVTKPPYVDGCPTLHGRV